MPTENNEEIKTIGDIKALKHRELLEAFEGCIRKGAGINSVPFLWYRKEILFRMVGNDDE